MNAMSGIHMGNFYSPGEQAFNFSDYKTLADIGGADGWLSVQIALHHPGIYCTVFDFASRRTIGKFKDQHLTLQTGSGLLWRFFKRTRFLQQRYPRWVISCRHG